MGETEERLAQGMERLVSRPAFGELLAMSAENVVSLMRIGSTSMDLVWRNLRIAGRGDLVRLGQQLARTEDKLERVLQELEEMRDSSPSPTRRKPKEKAKA